MKANEKNVVRFLAASLLTCAFTLCSAFAEVVQDPWFDEPTESEVTAGKLDSATWAASDSGDVGDYAKVTANTIAVDIDAGTSLTFTPGEASAGKQVISATLTFMEAYDSVGDLPSAEDCKGGLVLVKHEAAYRLAYVDPSASAWVEYEAADLTAATDAIDVRVTYDGESVQYEYKAGEMAEYAVIATVAQEGKVAKAVVMGCGTLVGFKGVVANEAAAQIVRTEKYYGSLEAAYGEAEAGDTIKLLADVASFDPAGETFSGKRVTIDRNGYAFDAEAIDQGRANAKGLKFHLTDGDTLELRLGMPFGKSGDGSWEIADAAALTLFKNGVKANSYATDVARTNGSTYAEGITKYTLPAGVTITIDEPWEGIGGEPDKDGKNKTGFMGTFDGNGSTIKLTAGFSAIGANEYRGIFNQTYKATIENLTTDVGSVEATETNWGFGGLAGCVNATTLRNITTTGTLLSGTYNCAGIVSRVGLSSRLIGCTNRITCVESSYTKVGGIAAITQYADGAAPFVFESCACEGEVKAANNGDNGAGKDGTAGILAYTDVNVTLTDCVMKGTLSGDEYATKGTLVGKLNGGAVVSGSGNRVNDDSVQAVGALNGTSKADDLSLIQKPLLTLLAAGDADYEVLGLDALAAGNTYKVVSPVKSIAFVLEELSDKIGFDTILNTTVTLNVTVSDALDAAGYAAKSEKAGEVVTFKVGYKDYTITYMGADGTTPFTSFKLGYTPPTGFSLAVTNTLPTAADVVLGEGDTFKGWINMADNKPITTTAGQLADLTVKLSAAAAHNVFIPAQAHMTYAVTNVTTGESVPCAKYESYYQASAVEGETLKIYSVPDEGYEYDGEAKVVTVTVAAGDYTVPADSLPKAKAKTFTLSIAAKEHLSYAVTNETTHEEIAVTVGSPCTCGIPYGDAVKVYCVPAKGFMLDEAFAGTYPYAIAKVTGDVAVSAAELPDAVIAPDTVLWFDGLKVGTWPAASNGTWSASSGELSAIAKFASGTVTFDSGLDEADPSLLFTPDAPHSFKDDLVYVQTRGTFSQITSEDLQAADLTGVKAGVTVVKATVSGGGEALFYYVVAQKAGVEENGWIQQPGLGTPTDGDLHDVTIYFRTNGTGHAAVKYVIDGAATDYLPLVLADAADAKVTKVTYRGSSEIKALVGTYETKAVASVDGVDYGNFDEAMLAAAASGSKVLTLKRDVVWDASDAEAAAAAHGVTVNLNGFAFSLSRAGEVAYIHMGQKLKVGEGGTLTVSAPFDGGDGSKAQPYSIESADTLLAFAYGVKRGLYGHTADEYFNMPVDIDLAGGETWPLVGAYVTGDAIAATNAVFRGCFAARDKLNPAVRHVISNVKLPACEGAALFGTLDGAVVCDLVVSNVTYAAAAGATGAMLAGNAKGAWIDNVLLTGANGDANKAPASAAGFVSRVEPGDDPTVFTNCVSQAALFSTTGLAASFAGALPDGASAAGFDSRARGDALAAAADAANGLCFGLVPDGDEPETLALVRNDAVAPGAAYRLMAPLTTFDVSLLRDEEIAFDVSLIPADSFAPVVTTPSAHTHVVATTNANVLTYTAVEDAKAEVSITADGVTFAVKTAEGFAVTDGTNVYAGTKLIVTDLAVTDAAVYKLPVVKINGLEASEYVTTADDTEVVIAGSATEITYAKLTYETTGRGLVAIAFTNAATGAGITVPYEQDVDSNEVIRVTYELRPGYKLADGCTVPAEITLNADTNLVVATVADGVEIRVPVVEHATVAVTQTVASVSAEVPVAVTEDGTNYYVVTSGAAVDVAYTADDGYALNGELKPSHFDNVTKSEDVAFTEIPVPVQGEVVFTVPVGEGVLVAVTNDTLGTVMTPGEDSTYTGMYGQVVSAYYWTDEEGATLSMEKQTKTLTVGVAFDEVYIVPDYLSLTATGGDVLLKMPEDLTADIEVCAGTPTGEWTALGSLATTNIAENATLYLRTASGTVQTKVTEGGRSFTMTSENGGFVELNGNAMTLLDKKGKSRTVGGDAFKGLFRGCTNLVSVAADLLPATNLAQNCYNGMFIGCTALTVAPELPATNLAATCYSGMFSGCTALAAAPELPAETLATGCYMSMFSGCTNLSAVTVGFTNWRTGMTVNWLKDVAPTGTFICPPELEIRRGASNIPNGWLVNPVKVYVFKTLPEHVTDVEIICDTQGSDALYEKGWQNYSVYNVSTNDMIRIRLICESGYAADDIVFKADKLETFVGGEVPGAIPYPAASAVDYLSLTATGGDVLLQMPAELAADIEVCAGTSHGTWTALGSGATTNIADGTTLYLRTASDAVLDKVGNSKSFVMTSENGVLTAGGNAMTLLDKTGKSCTVGAFAFDGLFCGCTKLASVAANLLPATNLASYCYGEMFKGCTSLAAAPKLPATTLAEGCYSEMFAGCTALTAAPALPVKTLATSCYSQMFEGCEALAAAPELPATTLVTSCYHGMFTGCTNLSAVTVGFTSWLEGATMDWLKNVAAKGTFICPPELTVEVKRGASNIPNGWLVNPVKIEIGSLPAGIADVTIENKTTGSGYVKTADGYLVSTNDTFELIYAPAPGYVLDFKKSGEKTAGKAVTTVGTDDSADIKFPGAVLPDYLSFTATGGDVLLKMPKGLTADIEVCAGTPQGTWTALGSEMTTNIAEGTTLYLRTSSDAVQAKVAENNGKFVMTSENGGFVEMDGNAMTLLDKTGKSRTVGQGAFSGLFQNCAKLVSVSADLLPATNLAAACYRDMFSYCTALTAAPELPAKTLVSSCYNGMFYGCTALEAAPALPAANLANSCYGNMFTGCTNLSAVTVGFTSWWTSATTQWLKDVAPTGTFLCPPELEIKRGESNIPNGWLVNPVKIQIGSLPVGVADVTIENKTTGSGYVKTADGYLVSTNDTFELTYVPAPGYALDFTKSGEKTAEKAVTTVGTDDSADIKFPGSVLPDYLSFKATGGDVLVQMPEGLVVPIEVCAGTPHGTWTALNSEATTNIAAGTTLYLRTSSETELAKVTEEGASFIMTPDDDGLLEIGGSAMTLLDRTGKSRTVGENAFGSLFGFCGNLVSVAEDLLPATNLASMCYAGMFAACNALETVPKLPATKLAEGCYMSMFASCYALKTAPQLPATELAANCYAYMFQGCEALEVAPQLPVMNLAEGCYEGMFQGCMALVAAPALPATVLAENCYAQMFSSCYALETAPQLPATVLAKNCYAEMFSGCDMIEVAPALPATELAANCYEQMFVGCMSLTVAPKLPATALVSGCYKQMFWYCELLSEVEVGFTDWVEDATKNWLEGVAETGTFLCPPELAIERGVSRIPDGWLVNPVKIDRTGLVLGEGVCDEYAIVNLTDGSTVVTNADGSLTVSTNDTVRFVFAVEDPEHYVAHPSSIEVTAAEAVNYAVETVESVKRPNYLRFHALETNTGVLTVKMPEDVEVSTGNDPYGDWAEIAKGGTTNLAAGAALYIRRKAEGVATLVDGQFGVTGAASDLFEATGSVMTLLDKTDESRTVGEAAFSSLFDGCTNLVSVAADLLPATNLDEMCYAEMFAGCTALEVAPALPATNLASECYVGMFADCTALEVAPELPATNLDEMCYAEMFAGCTALTNAPALPAEKLAYGCYSSMFNGCTALETAPALPATELADGCYYGMFGACEALEEAPALDATTLAPNCYMGMFAFCTALTEAPELPAPELADACYAAMFEDCANLSSVTVGFTNWLYGATDNWLKNVAATGTFICPPGLSTQTRDASHVPVGWFANPVIVNVKWDARTLPEVVTGYELIDTVPGTPVATNGNSYVVSSNDTLRIHWICPEGYLLEDTVVTANADPLEITVPVPEAIDYLSFTATGGDVLLKMPKGLTADIEVCAGTPHGTWTALSAELTTNIAEGTTLYLRTASDAVQTKVTENNGKFVMTSENGGLLTADGNAMTLLDRSGKSRTVGEEAFKGLFRDCDKLASVAADLLPATNLAQNCYSDMFGSCTALEVAPELPATNLAKECYYDMFRGCTALEVAPELPATNLAEKCYYGMFVNCKALAAAPELPAENLATNCYDSMFYSCKALAVAPELPATTLVTGCYNGMFYGCTALTTAPELPATTLAESCYANMFSGCTNLSAVTVGFTSWRTGATTDWLKNVAPTGTFICPPELEIKRGTSLIPNGWLANPVKIDRSGLVLGEGVCDEYAIVNLTDGSTVVTNADGSLTVSTNDTVRFVFAVVDPEHYVAHPSSIEVTASEEVNCVAGTVEPVKRPNYLRFHALESNTGVLTVMMPEDVEVSTDNDPYGDWAEIAKNGTTNLSAGAALYIRRKAEDVVESLGVAQFLVTGGEASDFFEATGSAMTLLDKTDESRTVGRDAFRNLFLNCVKLVSVPEDLLPATNLAANCYDQMFRGCKALTNAPALPVTTLAFDCYVYMFYDCTALTVAPELPAMELASGCYNRMFYGCKALTVAPELPATELVGNCYKDMFAGCENLSSVTVGFTSWPYGATSGWLSGVAAKGTFLCPPELAANTPVAERGGDTIPVGWLVNPKTLTVETIDPNLTMVVTNVTEGCETELVELPGDIYDISSNATVEVRFAAKEGWELFDGPLSTDGVVTYDPFAADTILWAADQPHAVKLFEITVLNVLSGLCFSVTNDLRGDLTGVVNGPTNEVKAAVVSNTTSSVVFKPMAGFKFLNQPRGTQEVAYEFAAISSDKVFDAQIYDLAVTNAFLLTIPKAANMSVAVTVDGQPMELTEGDDAWTCSIDGDATGDVVITFTPAEGYLLDDPSKGTITMPVSSIKSDITIASEQMPASRIIVAYVKVGEGDETPAWNATNVIHTLTNAPSAAVEVRYVAASADIDTMPADAPFAFAAGARFAMNPDLLTLTVAGEGLAVKSPLTVDVNYDIANNVAIKADLLSGEADAVVLLRGDLTVARDFTVGAGAGTGMVQLSVDGEVTCEGGAKIALAKAGAVKAKAVYEGDIVRAADEELRGYQIVKTPLEEGYVLFSLKSVGVAVFEIEGELPLYVDDDGLMTVWEEIETLTALDPYLLIMLDFLEDTSLDSFKVPAGARLTFVGTSIEVDLPEGAEFEKAEGLSAGRELVVFGDQAKVNFAGQILAQADVTDWTENTYVDLSYVWRVKLLSDVTVGVTNEQAVTAMNGAAELWLPYFYNQEQITLEDYTARIKVTKFGRVLSPLPRVELNNLVGLAGDLIVPADGDDYEIHCEYDEYLERFVYTERLKGSFEVKEVGDDGVTLKYISMAGETAEEVLERAVIGCPDEKARKTISWTRSQAAYAAMFDLSVTENPDGLGWLVTATLKPEIVAAIQAALNEAAAGIMTDALTRQTGKVDVKTIPGLCYTVYAAADAASENFAPDGPTAYGDGESKRLTFTAKSAKGRCFKVKAEFKTPPPPHNNH